MPRYVLTGAPGAGKTAILRALERAGQQVVDEAATDVIALEHALGRTAPEADPQFLDKIASLQRARQQDRAADAGRVVFFDRSPVCTLALARFLGRPVTPGLAAELERIKDGPVYEPAVFFVRNQGFVTPTAARRIGLADSLAFEQVHEQVYAGLGFRLIEVPAGPLAGRVALIAAAVGLRPPGAGPVTSRKVCRR
jgi:predicted ATPase